MVKDFISSLSVSRLLLLNQMVIDSLNMKPSDEIFDELSKLDEQIKNVKTNKDYDRICRDIDILKEISGFDKL
jgi:hypothetical protein